MISESPGFEKSVPWYSRTLARLWQWRLCFFFLQQSQCWMKKPRPRLSTLMWATRSGSQFSVCSLDTPHPKWSWSLQTRPCWPQEIIRLPSKWPPDLRATFPISPAKPKMKKEPKRLTCSSDKRVGHRFYFFIDRFCHFEGEGLAGRAGTPLRGL